MGRIYKTARCVIATCFQNPNKGCCQERCTEKVTCNTAFCNGCQVPLLLLLWWVLFGRVLEWFVFGVFEVGLEARNDRVSKKGPEDQSPIGWRDLDI